MKFFFCFPGCLSADSSMCVFILKVHILSQQKLYTFIWVYQANKGDKFLKETVVLRRWEYSLRRRANARNVSFRISLRWPIHIIQIILYQAINVNIRISHARVTLCLCLKTSPRAKPFENDLQEKEHVGETHEDSFWNQETWVYKTCK